ncbi:porin family protein [Vibrio tasmaniensis]|uniref:porin family protein n=2 Tax=Vibrionaceae TaxID=641 RepID=UPI001F518801|nr:porin family protein [Vibrio tasmaniensis]
MKNYKNGFDMKKMIVTLALIAPLSAVAAQKDPNGFYIGVGAGSTELDDGGFGKAITRKTTTTETESPSYKLIAGYQINRIIGIEGQYTKYGTSTTKVGSSKAFTTDFSSISVAANVGYTFDIGLRPYALLGYSFLNSEIENSGNNKYFATKSSTVSGIKMGVGVVYAIPAAPALALRAGIDWEAADIKVKDEKNKELSNVHTLGSFYLATTYTF